VIGAMSVDNKKRAQSFKALSNCERPRRARPNLGVKAAGFVAPAIETQSTCPVSSPEVHR
jgi:hypothetical protein